MKTIRSAEKNLSFDKNKGVFVIKKGVFIDRNGFRHYSQKEDNNLGISKFEDFLEIQKALLFLEKTKSIKKRKTFNNISSSYGFKHKAEEFLRKKHLFDDCYISNGAFIIAMYKNGFDIKIDIEYYKKMGFHSFNVYFNVSFSRGIFNNELITSKTN
jgi:hypothetical protein